MEARGRYCVEIAIAPIPSPLLQIISKQALLMLRAASELGFSPISRTRLVASDGASPCAGQAFDDWLAEEPEPPREPN
jgi:phage terminase small subunit